VTQKRLLKLPNKTAVPEEKNPGFQKLFMPGGFGLSNYELNYTCKSIALLTEKCYDIVRVR